MEKWLFAGIILRQYTCGLILSIDKGIAYKATSNISRLSKKILKTAKAFVRYVYLATPSAVSWFIFTFKENDGRSNNHHQVIVYDRIEHLIPVNVLIKQT